MKIIKTLTKLVTAAGVLAAAAGAGIFHFGVAKNGGGKYLRKYTMKKAYGGDTDTFILERSGNRYIKDMNKRIKEFMEKVGEKKVTITSFDDTPLTGFVYENKFSSRWVIAFHGYRGTHKEILYCGFATHFYDMGYNVLAPDQRASGESGGKYIGMGWLERKDVLAWIDWILEREPDAEIILFGDSMGASTVLAASGEKLPDNVKVVISDSAYGSVRYVFDKTTHDNFKLQLAPIISIGNMFSRFFAGYDFSEADICSQVAKSTVPILFFHGKDDKIVCFDNLEKLYKAKHGCKEMHAVEGAGHVCSSFVLGDEYWQIIRDFIARY